jgi:3-deoxy-D-manno-octulosonate 8-phosphate phosphatase (KDO 8-P phosphatase)
VLDVDGVLTDGRLHFGPRGEALKVFHARDGHGIKELGAAGISVAVISGRKSPMVAARCRELGVAHVFQGQQDKLAPFERLASELGIASSQCACIGDDVPDIPLMRKVGLAFAVGDAHPLAKKAAHIVTELPGGYGAVREACYLLAARTVTAARSQPRASGTRAARARSVAP